MLDIILMYEPVCNCTIVVNKLSVKSATRSQTLQCSSSIFSSTSYLCPFPCARRSEQNGPDSLPYIRNGLI